MKGRAKKMAIFERIAEYLEENYLQQKLLSDKTGIQQNKISAMLNGNRKITADEYIQLCDALGLDPGYFVLKEREAKEKSVLVTGEGE
jgi:plasmid maintenance system antidote protein VapI